MSFESSLDAFFQRFITNLAAGQNFIAGMLKPLQGILDGSLSRLIMPYSMTEKAMQSIPFFCEKVIFFCGKVGTGRAAAGVPK
jgi:hypothetical protein